MPVLVGEELGGEELAGAVEVGAEDAGAEDAGAEETGVEGPVKLPTMQDFTSDVSVQVLPFKVGVSVSS